PLLAVAEEGPADAALVVLGAGERQRQQGDAPLVRELRFGRQLRGPERVIRQVERRQAGVRVAVEQAAELGEHLPADLDQPGANREGLLELADVPAERVVGGEELRVRSAAAVGLPPDPRRREELRVGVDGEVPLAAEGVVGWDELAPAGGHEMAPGTAGAVTP